MHKNLKTKSFIGYSNLLTNTTQTSKNWQLPIWSNHRKLWVWKLFYGLVQENVLLVNEEDTASFWADSASRRDYKPSTKN